MKISYQWLSEYLSPLPEPKALAEILTNLGLEVEDLSSFVSPPGKLEGLVVGHVVSVLPHPNADRLKNCLVDVGGHTPLSIVCGAPNVCQGQQVIVAPLGTTVYPTTGAPFLIERSKIRGQWSEGMLCADDEIGLGSDHDGIRIIPSDWTVGSSLHDYIHPYEDYVFDIGITPNRSDALSHRGVARDVLAFTHPIGQPNPVPKEQDFAPGIQKPEGKRLSLSIQNPESCLRLSGVQLDGVVVGESPDWLKNKLRAIGIRPINNVVDVTNFICHDLGQPIHAYDCQKIEGDHIAVGLASRLSTLVTLDGKTRILHPQDLVILDGHHPIGLAGIFGGSSTRIQEGTTSIFLESACFLPTTIRKSARRHDLYTDASFRFERGTDPEGTIPALTEAVQLLTELCQAHQVSDFIDHYPSPKAWPTIVLFKSNLTTLAGQALEEGRVEQILISLGLKILNRTHKAWTLSVPLFKVDVTREADIIEEILRVYGYNRISVPSKIHLSLPQGQKHDPDQIQETIANYLSAAGFHEVHTNSLIGSLGQSQTSMAHNVEPIKILNPLSVELDTLRTNMLASSLRVASHNINRKVSQFKFYEFGRVYRLDQGRYVEKEVLALTWSGALQADHWQGPKNGFDPFFYAKGTIERLFIKMFAGPVVSRSTPDETLGMNINFFIHETILGYLGQVKPRELSYFGMDKPIYHAQLDWSQLLDLHSKTVPVIQEISRFPPVYRDLSLLVPNHIEYSQIQDILLRSPVPLIQEWSVFDVYHGERSQEDKKSVSMRFVLQNHEKTLTDLEIDEAMGHVMDLLVRGTGGEFRLN